MSETGPAAQQLFQAALGRHREGDLAGALDGYQAVVGLDPDHGAAHHNMAVLLRALRRPAEALVSADRATALRPGYAQGHVTRGRALADLNRATEALACYERAAELAPDDPIAHREHGIALLSLGRGDEALAACDRGLDVAPDNAGLHLSRGAALGRLERHAEAAEAFVRAGELDPGLVQAHRNLALTLRRLGRRDEALAAVGRALASSPDDAALHSQRARLLLELDRPQEALGAFDRALILESGSAEIHNGRGSALVALERLEEGLTAYDRAVALDPDMALAHRNRGVVLRRLRRTEAAVAAYDRAIELAPDQPSAQWYRSLCHLLQGRFEAGWRDYERRWEVEEFRREARGAMTPTLRARLEPRLHVEDLAGRDVLLVGEQGVGDVIMFASAIPDLLAVAGRVAIACDGRLRRLFAASFPTVAVFDGATAARQHGEFATILGVGSLGRLFRNRREDFPGGAYLTPAPETVARWADRLGPAGGRRRIGISWRGGLARTGRAARSLDLAQLRPMLDLPGCEFVSLQYGDPSAEVAAVNEGLASPIRLFPAAEIDDFDDLAALVVNLDLVVSVQTSLVHLTGALGAPGLVMVPRTPEWRYLAEGSSMPWYRSIRLFRQDEDGDWGPVVRAVAAAMAERPRLRPPSS